MDRPVDLDCETRTGIPQCMGAIHSDGRFCTCEHLTREVHVACEAEAHRLAAERKGEMCHDCAFRKGSPEAGEEDMLRRLAEQREPFRCHQAMPLDGRGRKPTEGIFAPRGPTLYPICAGWLRARKDRLDAL